MERRIAPLAADGKKLVGYASVFAPARSVDLGGFIEEVAPTAFDASLSAKADVLALWNHDTSAPLGRVSNGALALRKDARGLSVVIDPPEGVSYAEDLKLLIARKDVKSMSFGFTVRKDSWRQEGGMTVRTLHSVDLFEVSIVTAPAYPDTSIAMRGLAEFNKRQRAEWLLRNANPDPRLLRIAFSRTR